MTEKKKYQLEYILKTSPKILYNMISTPSGLSEWFSEDVNIRLENYTFFWEGEGETARLITKKNNEFIKFHWLEDEEEKTFFELRIAVDPLTSEVALMITDFAEEDEQEETQLLWDNQVAKLKQVLGG